MYFHFPEQEEDIKKNVPDYVITHGILSKPDLEKLLQETKVCLFLIRNGGVVFVLSCYSIFPADNPCS